VVVDQSEISLVGSFSAVFSENLDQHCGWNNPGQEPWTDKKDRPSTVFRWVRSEPDWRPVKRKCNDERHNPYPKWT